MDRVSWSGIAEKRRFRNPLGADKPLKSPLPRETLDRARAYRLRRIRQQLAQHDCGTILLYNPVNIRDALDTPNMQLWTMHEAVRYAVIFLDGPAIIFEFKGCEHLCRDLPEVDEIRNSRTGQEIWAELHYANTRSGGKWFETRLLSCGSRTDPWYQEASDDECNEGEMISFDIDMIGPYGYCTDLSRSWTCGHTRITDTQHRLYSAAREQIEHTLLVLKAGMSFREFTKKSWQIPERHQPYRYALALHGVGMSDDWPLVPFRTDQDVAYEGMLEENMVLCVEGLIAEPGTRSSSRPRSC